MSNLMFVYEVRNADTANPLVYIYESQRPADVEHPAAAYYDRWTASSVLSGYQALEFLRQHRTLNRVQADAYAMKLYNAMWASTPLGDVTRELYRNLRGSAAFKMHLTNEAIVRLGGTVEGHKSRSYYGSAAQEFLNWMTMFASEDEKA